MLSVLLVDSDVDVLGELSAKLRSRGLNVVLADSAGGCLAQVEASAPDAILVSADSMAPGEIQSLRERIRDTPMYLLVDRTSAECSGLELPRGDAETIAKRLHAVPVKTAPSRGGDFRGDLKHVPIADLLQLLSMNRRTGTLSLITSGGAGEIRLSLGQIADAVYRRLEGEKALYRLLGETDGSFQFVEGTAAPLSRFSLPPQSLLMEGTRQLDELRRSRAELDLGGDALVVVDSASSDAAAKPSRKCSTK
jgi:CheY-like chemotaxis protein